MERVAGPDFPTGGVIVEPRASLLDAYETGRGGVRVRARWSEEKTDRGGYRIVVSEIPYQVQKSKLVEQLAALIEAKRAPLLGDVRDESAEEVRLVLEPRARTVDPAVLMESLFRLSDLETRFPVNLNVLDRTATPGVLGLKACLRHFLDHRRDVDGRRARWRLARIDARLHVLAGLLIAYLNLDEVILIVRYEDDPKARLIAALDLSAEQADAILNTRLRQLAKLEEMELNREQAALSEEKAGLEGRLSSEAAQWKKVAADLRHTRERLGKLKGLAPRRSLIADAPVVDVEAALEAAAPREPITVILSERGWIRAAKGKVEDPSRAQVQGGRQAGLPRAGRDHRQAPGAGRRWARVHRAVRQAPRRPRPGRAPAADDRAGTTAPASSTSSPTARGASGWRPPPAATASWCRRTSSWPTARRASRCSTSTAGPPWRWPPPRATSSRWWATTASSWSSPWPSCRRWAAARASSCRATARAGCATCWSSPRRTGSPPWTPPGRRREWADWRDWSGRRAASGKAAPRGLARQQALPPRVSGPAPAPPVVAVAPMMDWQES